MFWHAGVVTECEVTKGSVEWDLPLTLPLLYDQGRGSETEQTVAEGLRLTSMHRQDPHSRDNKGHGTGVAMECMVSLH
jgi:hypothetical protein